MIIRQIPTNLRAGTGIAVAILSVSCSEANRPTMLENPIPIVEAALVISDSVPPVGGSLTVSVRAIPGQGAVASYTAKITYDSAALRYEREAAISDEGIRASNSLPGSLRIAGAAPAGFADGLLGTYTFTALRTNSTKTLTLIIDEMHLVTRMDAKSRLVLAPMHVESR